jgi:putative membrane protein
MIVVLAVGLLLVLPILGMGIGMLGTGMMGGQSAGQQGVMVGPWFPVVGYVVPMLLVVGLLVGGAYVIFGPMAERSADEVALAELRQAYTDGEFSEEDYQDLRDSLESDR